MKHSVNAIRGPGRILQPEEWRSGDTVALARSLPGRFLVRTATDWSDAQMITEVEAYDGERDRACHACRGRTPRTEVMYRPGGCWYVYFVYGAHEMLNLVTGPEGWPAAVLIRGLAWVNGPGRLTRALRIDRTLNGAPARPEHGLHLEDRGVIVPEKWIHAGPRIGVASAGPEWAAKPWRFWIDPRQLDPAAVQPPPGPR